MHAASINPAVFQRTLVLALPVSAAAWFLTVPVWLTPSTFVALFGFFAGCVWVLKTPSLIAQPANRLTQPLHDADVPAAIERARELR